MLFRSAIFNRIKTELEDLSLSYLDPVAYSEISKLLATKQEERKESVAKMMASVKQILDDNSYQYRILGRAKSIYSIYKKMFVKKKRFDELYFHYSANEQQLLIQLAHPFLQF